MGCFEVRLLPYGKDPTRGLDSELGVRSRGEQQDGWRHLGFTDSSLDERALSRIARGRGSYGDVLRVGYDLTGEPALCPQGRAFFVVTEDAGIYPVSAMGRRAALCYEEGGWHQARGAPQSSSSADDMLGRVRTLVSPRVASSVLLDVILEVLRVDLDERWGEVFATIKGALRSKGEKDLDAVLRAQAGCSRLPSYFFLRPGPLATRAVCEAVRDLGAPIRVALPEALVAYRSLQMEGGVKVWNHDPRARFPERWLERGGRVSAREKVVASPSVHADFAARVSRLFPLGKLLLLAMGKAAP